MVVTTLIAESQWIVQVVENALWAMTLLADDNPTNQAQLNQLGACAGVYYLTSIMGWAGWDGLAGVLTLSVLSVLQSTLEPCTQHYFRFCRHLLFGF